MAELRILERINLSDNDSRKLREVLDKPSQKKEHQKDFRGRTCVANQMSRVYDDRFEKNDSRRKVATLHRHLTDTGEIGFSGKPDPKRITTQDSIEYSLMPPDGGKCDLCEGGDMISPWRRQLFSPYRPGERKRHRIWRWIKIRIGRFRAIVKL